MRVSQLCVSSYMTYTNCHLIHKPEYGYSREHVIFHSTAGKRWVHHMFKIRVLSSASDLRHILWLECVQVSLAVIRLSHTNPWQSSWLVRTWEGCHVCSLCARTRPAKKYESLHIRRMQTCHHLVFLFYVPAAPKCRCAYRILCQSVSSFLESYKNGCWETRAELKTFPIHTFHNRSCVIIWIILSIFSKNEWAVLYNESLR